MNEIQLGEKKHPIAFDWLAFEAIAGSLGYDSPDVIGTDLQKLASQLPFNRVVLFEGLKCGYRKIGEKCPFESSNDVVELIESLLQVAPVLGAFTEGLVKFYGAGEAVESKSKKKATP